MHSFQYLFYWIYGMYLQAQVSALAKLYPCELSHVGVTDWIAAQAY